MLRALGTILLVCGLTTLVVLSVLNTCIQMVQSSIALWKRKNFGRRIRRLVCSVWTNSHLDRLRRSQSAKESWMRFLYGKFLKPLWLVSAQLLALYVIVVWLATGLGVLSGSSSLLTPIKPAEKLLEELPSSLNMVRSMICG